MSDCVGCFCRGAFATCRIGHKRGNPALKVAVKTLRRDHPSFDEESMQHEIRIMQAVNHPRCIRLIEVQEDATAVHLVEELASGGELFDRIIDAGHFTEVQAAVLMQQIVRAIYYMHENKVPHHHRPRSSNFGGTP